MSTPIQIPVPPLAEDVLKLPTQASESSEITTNKVVDRIMKFADLSETIGNEAKQSYLEMHQDRMFFLREQLKFLKETEWKYPPIDELIGSSSSSSAISEAQ